MALLSVSDKTGIVALARGLVEAGVHIVSSGGTARALSEAGVAATTVAEITGAGEMLEGRVKTLHPAIHGAILADRRKPSHLEELASRGIRPIDLVVCNLYPFARTAEDSGSSEDDIVEQIDIGGPAMVRAAAKNFSSVAVVVRPEAYSRVLQEVREGGGISEATRRALARDAFAHTGAYDAAIARHLSEDHELPSRLVLVATKHLDLRYGENPQQRAALYRDGLVPGGIAAAEQLSGKDLSYNNLLDADAAWALVCELDAPAAAIVKHSNPSGVSVAASLGSAYARALQADRTSAYGGVVALNSRCDVATARAMSEIFTEVVVAPGYDDDALDALRAKPSLRVLVAAEGRGRRRETRSISGGMLVQSADPADDGGEAKVVTKIEPTDEQWRDLSFAWIVAKHVKSNAIVLAHDLTAVGIGAGQMSRVEATELAARRAGERAPGTVCASDAFFPFRDGLEAAVNAGAVAIIQPGGSVRDEEVIAAADELGVAMVCTGTRHFRH